MEKQKKINIHSKENILRLKKLHIINCLVISLLVIGFISSLIINFYFTTPWAPWDVWVLFLAGLFFIFWVFWIFMKSWEFVLEVEEVEK